MFINIVQGLKEKKYKKIKPNMKKWTEFNFTKRYAENFSPGKSNVRTDKLGTK